MDKKYGKGGSCAALLTNLSEVSACIVHDVLVAQLGVYGFP